MKCDVRAVHRERDREKVSVVNGNVLMRPMARDSKVLYIFVIVTEMQKT